MPGRMHGGHAQECMRGAGAGMWCACELDPAGDVPEALEQNQAHGGRCDSGGDPG